MLKSEAAKSFFNITKEQWQTINAISEKAIVMKFQ